MKLGRISSALCPSFYCRLLFYFLFLFFFFFFSRNRRFVVKEVFHSECEKKKRLAATFSTLYVTPVSPDSALTHLFHSSLNRQDRGTGQRVRDERKRERERERERDEWL